MTAAPTPPRPGKPRGRPLAVVVGVGAVGSAVACALFRAGCRTVIVQNRPPATLRWAMSFSAALSEGRAVLDDIEAVHAASAGEALTIAAEGRAIPVVLAAFDDIRGAFAPDVIVDGRVRKVGGDKDGQNDPVDRLIGSAPLTIGIGPSHTAGETVDLVIESCWGDTLGRVIETGSAIREPGRPEIIAGLGWERFATAPASGVMSPAVGIGERVVAGQQTASVAGEPVPAPIGGRVRGLVPAGVAIRQGDKIVEVDPRDDDAEVSGLGLRARVIADAIAGAVRARLDG